MQTEFEFIEKIRRRAASSSVKAGIGDDCAVVPKDAKTDLVITTDMLVEDVDFRLNWTRPEFLGHKSLAVSLSDVAAMGAKPVWAMLSIGIPRSIWKTDFVERFYEGWFKLAEEFGIALVGGDVSETPDKIVIDSIAAGEVKKNKAVLRLTAKPGDLIFVTGELGGAACALELLENGERIAKMPKNPNPKQMLFLRQLRPDPQTEVGRILGEKNLATAMIDLSDGLSSDLAHLCRESKGGALIFADKIPIDENIKKILTPRREGAEMRKQGKSFPRELNFALNGGEDFELLFTVSPKKISRLKKNLPNLPFTQIGTITGNAEIIELISKKERHILGAKGFRHF